MQYRVKEKIFDDGHSDYYPQKKCFLVWRYFYREDLMDSIKIRYNTLDKANAYIECDIAYCKKKRCVKTKYHFINNEQ